MSRKAVLNSSQVALLRGVNVGGGKKVPMARLREIAADIGLQDAQTLLNSGNLVYRTTMTPDTVEQRLQAGIRESLGVDCRVFVRTPLQLQRVLEANPMPEEARSHPSRFVVTVWSAAVHASDLRCFADAPTQRERFVVGAEAVYMWFPDGLSASTVYDKAARPLGDRITARNWNTMQKLLNMATELDAD